MDMDLEESPGPHEASEALNSGLSTSCDLQILHSGSDPSQDYNEIKKEVSSIRPREGCPDWVCCDCCPAGFKSTQLSVVCYLFMGTFTLTSFVLLITFGVCLVAPYIYVLQFVPTTCKSVEYSYSAKMNCDCGGGKYDRCSSSYSCLKVYVQFDLPSNKTVYAQLFESELELRGKECSYAPICKEDEDINEKAVTDYGKKWAGDQRPFKCLYHEDQPKEVIRTVRFNKNNVLHLMLWPSLLGLIFTFCVLLTYKVYGCRDCKICINRMYRTVVLCEHFQHSDWGQ